MLRSRPVRVALRALALGWLGLAGVALLAGCGSGGGEGTATLPPGVSAPGNVTLPDDVAVTRPPEEAPADEPVAEEPVVEPPAEEPIVDPPAEDPAADVADDADAALDEATTDDDLLWWPWVLGLVVVVVAVVALVVSRSRRGSAAWTTRTLATLDASDALTTHLLALAPKGLVVVARDDAQRLTDLDATTHDLVRTAPDDRARGAIEGMRAPLAQLHAAVDMVSLSPTPTASDLALVRQWASALHVATATARSTSSIRTP